MAVELETLTQDILSSSSLVLVDFGAPWCSLCRMIQPTLHRLASEWPGSLVVVPVNVDDHFTLAHRFKIKSLPTLLLFKYGIEVRRFTHFSHRDQMITVLTEGLQPYLMQPPQCSKELHC